MKCRGTDGSVRFPHVRVGGCQVLCKALLMNKDFMKWNFLLYLNLKCCYFLNSV